MTEIRVSLSRLNTQVLDKLHKAINITERRTLKKLGSSKKNGGVWAYDYNRRPSQNYQHSISKWSAFEDFREGVIGVVFSNSAINNSNQHYAKYLLNPTYNSPQLTNSDWQNFVEYTKNSMIKLVKGL